jgi:YgiT-type zinc finger domain-containing protein
MQCPVCKVGTVRAGQKTLFFEKNGRYAIVQNVSCHVCDTCGEAYLGSETAQEMMTQVREMTDSTKLVEVAPAKAA